jgi:hypothetical protein
MGKPCTVCVHPDHGAIDTALEVGHPLRHVAATYGVSKTALHRHSQAHVFGRQLPQSLPAQSPTTQHGFLSRVKTIAKWVVGIGVVGGGFVWLVVTAPPPTSGAQGR